MLSVMRALAFALVTCAVASSSFGEADSAVAVYESGTHGYACFRIPAVVRTLDGDLLAFAEGRHDSCSDTGNIDLVMRRSTDGGATWGELQIVVPGDGDVSGNPAPLVDRDTGFVWLPFTRNRGEDKEHLIHTGEAPPRSVWITHSEDGGATWSAPREISDQTRRDTWRWYATGPGHSIQLKDGTFLVPCDHSASTDFGNWHSHVLLSHDHGQTWEIGAVLGGQSNECMAAELADGRVYLNMRSYTGRKQRLVSWSNDGGKTWTPNSDDPTLVEPVCQASVLDLPPATEGEVPVLFANPASTKRERMTIRLSRNGGATWDAALELWPGPAAYSDLVALGNDTYGCLYERGEKNPYETIVFQRFTRDAVETN